MKTIKELLNERIVIIDGAMGTMIQRYKKRIIAVIVLKIGRAISKAITICLV
jgi:hypothetical protein